MCFQYYLIVETVTRKILWTHFYEHVMNNHLHQNKCYRFLILNSENQYTFTGWEKAVNCMLFFIRLNGYKTNLYIDRLVLSFKLLYK